SGDTAAVTGGRGQRLHTFVHWKYGDAVAPQPLDRVIALLRELESLSASDSLDIEFAFAGGELLLLQARPLVAGARPAIKLASQKHTVAAIAERVAKGIRPHPYLSGD